MGAAGRRRPVGAIPRPVHHGAPPAQGAGAPSRRPTRLPGASAPRSRYGPGPDPRSAGGGVGAGGGRRRGGAKRPTGGAPRFGRDAQGGARAGTEAVVPGAGARRAALLAADGVLAATRIVGGVTRPRPVAHRRQRPLSRRCGTPTAARRRLRPGLRPAAAAPSLVGVGARGGPARGGGFPRPRVRSAPAARTQGEELPDTWRAGSAVLVALPPGPGGGDVRTLARSVGIASAGGSAIRHEPRRPDGGGLPRVRRDGALHGAGGRSGGDAANGLGPATLASGAGNRAGPAGVERWQAVAAVRG